MAATRKSTPKFNIVRIDTGFVVYGPASKTECKEIARGMNIKGRRRSVDVKPVRATAAVGAA